MCSSSNAVIQLGDQSIGQGWEKVMIPHFAEEGLKTNMVEY